MHDILASLKSSSEGRYWGLLGIAFVEAEPGRCVCTVNLAEQHLNYNDVVHGGVISSLVDSAAGGAVRSVRTPEEIAAQPHATTDLHVSYLSPAMGDELTAVAKVIKAGRTAMFTEVEVTDDRGRLVAKGMVTFVVASRPPASGGR